MPSICFRCGVPEVWHDREMLPGDTVDEEIAQKLRTADLVLVLVSPSFINSEYCWDIELKNAIERHERDRLTEWFKGKVVVFLPNPIAGGSVLLPTGQTVTNSVVHLHVLNMLLTDNRLHELGAAGRSLTTLLVAVSYTHLTLPTN